MRAICLVALFFGSAFAFAQSEPLTRESLEGPMFQSIGVKAGQPAQLQLRFKSSGGRFLLFRGGKEDKVSDYNETVTVKPGEAFTLTEHHGSLEFAPLPKPLDQHGWLVSLNFDERSFGGNESARYAILLILPAAELRFVQPDPNFDPKLPPTDSTYQRIVKLIAAATPLSTHNLFARTAAGQTLPPFPKSITAVFFEWKRLAQNAAEPLEIRWIAADTGGVAPPNHLISSSKSEPGRTEGSFTLSKPTNGFPPGMYRLELWQGGRITYSETFEIRKAE